MLTTEYRWK